LHVNYTDAARVHRMLMATIKIVLVMPYERTIVGRISLSGKYVIANDRP
jgi:hypothetical protein